MDSPSDRAVVLEIPARPEYLGLARLALSAVCRLTPLDAEDVADLKLAMTEAANALIDHAGDVDLESGAAAEDEPVNRGKLRFAYTLGERELVLEVEAEHPEPAEGEELELGRAIIEATVDSWHYGERSTRLVKRL